jgi:hypothetical protein
LIRSHLGYWNAMPSSSAAPISRYLTLFAVVWIVAWTWKLYPQFKDLLRVDGRLVALDDYVEDACGERVGPLATSCRATTLERGRRMVAAEQAKALLLVEAPLILCAVLYLPLRMLRQQPRTGEPSR